MYKPFIPKRPDSDPAPKVAKVAGVAGGITPALTTVAPFLVSDNAGVQITSEKQCSATLATSATQLSIAPDKMDKVSEFLANHIQLQPQRDCPNPLTYMVRADILLRGYRQWCAKNEVFPLEYDSFNVAISQLLLGGKLHKGIRRGDDLVDEWSGFRYVSGGLTEKERETNEQIKKVHAANGVSDQDYQGKLKNFRAAIRLVEPVKFWSKLLNEHFYLVSDEASQNNFQGKVAGEGVYTCAEILELVEKEWPPDHIIRVHKLKISLGVTIERTCH